MTHRAPLLTAALLACSACRTAPSISQSQTTDAVWSGPSPEPRLAARPTGACGAMRDVEEGDVLRALAEPEGLVLYANEQVGLLVADVHRPGDPAIVATSSFKGVPAAVFAVDGAAVVVYEPWDRAPTTVVRAIGLRGRSLGAVLGELELAGSPRAAHRLGDVLVVTRQLGTPSDPSTAVATFAVRGGGLVRLDEARFSGGGAMSAAAPSGVALAMEAAAEVGKDRTTVTWLDVAESGALAPGESVTFSGVVPRWRTSGEHTVDVTEDRVVRVLACATSACPLGDDGTYARLDFAEPGRPRLADWRRIARAGAARVSFDARRMYLLRSAADPKESELMVMGTEGDLVVEGTLPLHGTAASLLVQGEEGIVLGWTGAGAVGRRAYLSRVRLQGRPRLLGTAAFGGDFTWTPAFDDERSLSVDPTRTLAALPMTTDRGRGPSSAAQVFSLAPGPVRLGEVPLGPAYDRLVFVEGHLLAFASDGISVVTLPGEERVHRAWDVPLR